MTTIPLPAGEYGVVFKVDHSKPWEEVTLVLRDKGGKDYEFPASMTTEELRALAWLSVVKQWEGWPR